MTSAVGMLTGCSVCRSTLVEAINRRLANRESPERVSAWLRDIGPEAYVSPPTLRKHRNEHLTEAHERQRIEAAEHLAKQKKTIRSKPGDLAQLVRDNVFARVEDGELSPTIPEGLRAQEMIERRTEKAGDRDLMLQLAGLLSGATQPVALMDGNTIEGTYRDLEAEEDEASFRLADRLLEPLR